MTLIKTKIGRRSFLKTSASVGGGMLIGFNWLVNCQSIQKNHETLIPEEWFVINGYIKIGKSGMVTIFSPNPEIGQNVKTSMPMIVAEELDVPWDHVIVEQGALDEDVFKNPQFAGGSLSIMRGWDALRIAGATGKQMLLKAASKEWGISIKDLSASQGMIRALNGNRSIGYGDIASKAVSINVPENVKLKEPKDYKLIGSYQDNVDGIKIVKGKSLFGLDFKQDDMLISMLVHPPAFGMSILDSNIKEIKTMRGVKDAFMIDSSVPDEGWADVNAFKNIIAIVGESTWELIQAKKALKVTWKKTGELESSEIHSDRLENDLKNGKVTSNRKDGNPDKAFKSASKVIERTYSSPFMAHNTLEPMNFFANVKRNSIDLTGPTQTPKALRESVSKVLKMDIKKIKVNMTRMGGGFGRRLYVHFGVEASLISKKMGKPIKLIYTREDDMTQGTYRPAYRSTYKAGLDKNNNLIAFSQKGVGLPNGAIFPNRFPAGSVKNYIAESKKSHTNISTGAWRAPGSNFAACAEQSFIDEVAEQSGKDPIDFRLELLKKAELKPIGDNNDYDAGRYAGVLKLVREKSNWDAEDQNVFKGVSAYYCHNSYVAEVVEVVMNQKQPKIKKVWCAVDCGIVIDKEGAVNMIQGGVVDGIGHAMYSQLKFKKGKSLQSNFDTYQLIRLNQAPSDIEVFFVENENSPTGLGEPGLPPAAGALANALYKAIGSRLYHQPFSESDNFSSFL